MGWRKKRKEYKAYHDKEHHITLSKGLRRWLSQFTMTWTGKNEWSIENMYCMVAENTESKATKDQICITVSG